MPNGGPQADGQQSVVLRTTLGFRGGRASPQIRRQRCRLQPLLNIVGSRAQQFKDDIGLSAWTVDMPGSSDGYAGKSAKGYGASYDPRIFQHCLQAEVFFQNILITGKTVSRRGSDAPCGFGPERQAEIFFQM
jgi:hypothetical protein